MSTQRRGHAGHHLRRTATATATATSHHGAAACPSTQSLHEIRSIGNERCSVWMLSACSNTSDQHPPSHPVRLITVRPRVIYTRQVPLLTVEETTRERSNSESITLHGDKGVLDDGFAGISTVWSSAFTFTNFIIQPANPANLPQAYVASQWNRNSHILAHLPSYHDAGANHLWGLGNNERQNQFTRWKQILRGCWPHWLSCSSPAWSRPECSSFFPFI